MIIELNKKDITKIRELENIFSNIFIENSVSMDLKNNPYSNYLLYLIDNKIVGFINYYIIYERIEIANFNVLEKFQNNGIGNSLLKKLIDKYKKNKMNITLEVRVDNSNAIHLYEKYDFKKVAIRHNYYNGIDGILMEKELMKVKDIYVLGIESSCDETSFSIVKNGTVEISTVVSSQIDIHKDYGGVVPEIASREHVKNITFVLEECLEKAKMKMEDIDLIAVANGPGLIGSLLVGLECAKTLSWLYKKPLIPVHHIAGHIYANNLNKRLIFPLISLVISGGHTELIYMEKDYSFRKLGGTLDDAVGECYDKVAKVMKLDYPGGPKIDKLAENGNNCYKLPLPLNDNSYNFSFSGLKSAVINLVNNSLNDNYNQSDLACSFQNVVIESLTKKTLKALIDYDVKNLILAGGVSANKGIRSSFEKICKSRNINLSIPNIEYCTDNAAMIASAGYYAYLDGRKANLELNSESVMNLE